MQSPYEAVFSLSYQTGNKLHSGSAVLLEGGRYLVTAAHVVDQAPSPSALQLRNSYLPSSLSVAAIHTHPDWDRNSFNNDLAIIELSKPVTAVNGLPIYTGSTPIGQTFTLVGYGNGLNSPQHIGTNTWEATGEILNSRFNRSFETGEQLLYDYDNGEGQQNALSFYPGVNSSSQPTSNETIAFSGDSGGAAILNGQLAGINSYILSDPRNDSDADQPSSPGEIGATTNISAFQNWITYITQGNPVHQAPKQINDVQKSVAEPDFGSVINHFLLSTSVIRDEDVRLFYTTRDGTATAGKDYIAATGWVTINAGESSSDIPITILGDEIREGDETIELVISDPSGRWLDQGITLLAQHTISDNDPLA